MQHLARLIVCSAFAALSASAQADTVNLKLSGYQVGTALGTSAGFYRTMQWQVPAVAGTTLKKDNAGMFGGTLYLPNNATASFTAFCVDLANGIAPFPQPSPITYQTALGNSYFSSTVNSNLSKLFSENISFDTVQKTAAFQLAVWELRYETSGSFNISAGNSQFSTYAGSTLDSATLALAQSYLTNLPAVATKGLSVYYGAAVNGSTQQALVTAYALPVPEPASVVLMIAGVCGLGALSVRRNRAKG